MVAPSLSADQLMRVRHVVDGDTIIVADGRHIRLLGMDTPETASDERAADAFADKAHAALRKLLEGKKVKLVFDLEKFDRHGRTLAYVVTEDGVDAQHYLLEQGYARALAIPPNLTLAPAYFAAERRARAAKRGLWRKSSPTDIDSQQPIEPGFQEITGRIAGVYASDDLWIFKMARGFAVLVTHENWERYFTGDAKTWRGEKILARGWVGGRDGRRNLRVGHPLMFARIAE